MTFTYTKDEKPASVKLQKGEEFEAEGVKGHETRFIRLYGG